MQMIHTPSAPHLLVDLLVTLVLRLLNCNTDYTKNYLATYEHLDQNRSSLGFDLDLLLCISLVVSVLRNGRLGCATEAEVEAAIKNWLRLSKDRVGGQHRERP